MTAASIVDQLAAAGIRLNNSRLGEHRVPCPECDKGKNDTALGVLLEAQRATWHCFRCAWKGVASEGKPASYRPERKPPLQLRPPPETSKTAGSAMAALLRQCRPIATDSPQSRYLRGRGCAMPQNDVLAHPSLLHRPSGQRFPALVSIVTNVVTAEPQTLHFTFLAPDGAGKAAVDRPRLLMPGLPKADGVIRLFEDAEVETGLAIAEGLETALAAARIFTPVWAVVDAGNLSAFPVLAGVESLTVFADSDRPNPRTGRRAGNDAAAICARRWAEAGCEARIYTPPREGTDIADLAVEAAL